MGSVRCPSFPSFREDSSATSSQALPATFCPASTLQIETGSSCCLPAMMSDDDVYLALINPLLFPSQAALKTLAYERKEEEGDLEAACFEKGEAAGQLPAL